MTTQTITFKNSKQELFCAVFKNDTLNLSFAQAKFELVFASPTRQAQALKFIENCTDFTSKQLSQLKNILDAPIPQANNMVNLKTV